ncbi:MAG: MerR family DNA-binding transcriptional regulator [Anaerolineae bacterium]|nr:MerR family DNA-binding transcriptional regulator [Anaerolineae bacterium]MBN8619838.1 MerR family DNA-binding transcriptional regulator [Anaerolineae bacterium]
MNAPNFDAVSDEPLYNIGMVSRMTGVPVATLRVWERRYGFPTAHRTPGGHRLVSEREVIRLRWVKARVDEGMQTGQAIRALHHMEQEGRFPDMMPAPTASVRASVLNPSFATFRERLTELLLSNELQLADQLLGEVLTLYSLEDLILEVVSPSLSDIGQAWEEGRISVATEHLGSNFLRNHLLVWMGTGPQTFENVPPIILTCAPEEWHEGSLMSLGVLLRRRRWPVAYLGQNVPLYDVGVLARQMKSPAVIFVAMLNASARALIDWPRHFPDAVTTGRPLIGFGGQAFNLSPDLRQQVPGVFLGETLREGVEKIDSLLHTMLMPNN